MTIFAKSNKLLRSFIDILRRRNKPLPKSLAGISSSIRNGTVRASEFADGQNVIIFAHQDDDLLWMLPFWKVAQEFIYASKPSSNSHNQLVKNIGDFYEQRWTALWGTITDQEFVSIYMDPCLRTQYIHYDAIKSRLKSILCRQDIKRVITHNNWGEYGHIHHRWVNRAIRELAQDYGKDVWAISIRAFSNNMSRYVDTGTLGLRDYVYGNFNKSEFRALRSVYLKEDLDVRMLKPSLWTWGGGDLDFPNGTRLFLRLVHNGIDHTLQNEAIHQLEQEVPVFGTPIYSVKD